MAHLYARLIIKGRKNFSDVPEKFKEDTKTWIETDGYILNDDGTVTTASLSLRSRPGEIKK